MIKQTTFLVALVMVLGNLSLAQEYAVTHPATGCDWSCNDAENNIAGTATEHYMEGLVRFRVGKKDLGVQNDECDVVNTQFVCPGSAQVFDIEDNPIGLPVSYTQNDIYKQINIAYEDLGIVAGEMKLFYIETTSEGTGSDPCEFGGIVARTGLIAVKHVGNSHYVSPTITSPSDGDEVPLGVLIEWEAQGAEEYIVQIAQEHHGQIPMLHNECGFYDPDDVVCDEIIEGTDFVWTEGEPGRTYWLSVAVHEGTYGQSLFANIIEFTVKEDASTNLPTAITPTDDYVFAKKADLDEYTYSWTTGNCDPHHYSIIVERKDGNSDWKEILNEGWISGTEITVKKKDYKNGGIKGNGSYRWRIVGRGFSGGIVCYSEYFNFCVKICGDYATAETMGYFMDAGARYHVPYTLGLAIAKVETDFDAKPIDIGTIAPWVIYPYVSFGIMGVYPGAVQDAETDTWSGLTELAKMLRDGTYSGFEGWSEYQSMNNTEIINLIANNNIADQEAAKRANIRAGMLLLRYYAHFIQSDDMFYNPNTGVESNSEYPQMGLETWWFIVNRYNVRNGTAAVDDIKDLMESNYDFRVYNAIMDGVNENVGSIPITVPPHVNFRLATLEDLGVSNLQRGIAKQSDWSLIPTAPNEEDYVFVRITVPFVPRTHLGVIHDDEGNNIGLDINDYRYESEKFVLHFPLNEQSAYSARMTATFDFSDAKAGDGNRDGVVLGFTGEYGTEACGSYNSVTNSTGLPVILNTNYTYNTCISYDGHTAGDYSSGTGELQYPTATGIIRASSPSWNIYIIKHDNFGKGYETVYSHWSEVNTEMVGEITFEDMNTYVGKTGSTVPFPNTISPHMHVGIQCKGNVGSLESDWIYISPSGWTADSITELSTAKRSKDIKWTRSRYNILWSSQPRVILEEEEQVRVYPNPIAQGELNIVSKKDMQNLSLSTLTGTIVMLKSTNGVVASIGVSNIQNGMYILKVTNRDGSISSATVIISK